MGFVLVVRHAEIDLSRPAGDADPALNAAGRQRAEALAAWLGSAGVRHVYASGARRTQQTVAPLAARLGIVPRAVPDIDGLVAELKARAGEGAACVAGHTNTVPGIIAALGADAAGLGIDEADFASLFVVSGIGLPSPQVLRLSYGGVPP